MAESNTVYARVSNGVIIEYPVYLTHIETRGHPLAWYMPCVFTTKPTVPDFYYAREVPVVKDTYVQVNYSIEALPLEALFKMLPVDFTVEAPDVALVGRIKLKTIERIQKRLDDFAITRGYDGILAVCSYVSSSVTKFATEAAYCVSARDNTWGSLYTYWDSIEADPTTYPKSYEEIEAVLPVLEWPA